MTDEQKPKIALPKRPRRKLLLSLMDTSEGMDVNLYDEGDELELELDFGGNGTASKTKLGVSDAERLAMELRAFVRRRLMERRKGKG